MKIFRLLLQQQLPPADKRTPSFKRPRSYQQGELWTTSHVMGPMTLVPCHGTHDSGPMSWSHDSGQSPASPGRGKWGDAPGSRGTSGSVKYKMCTAHGAVCSVKCSVCILQCAVCSVQCAVFIVVCRVNSFDSGHCAAFCIRCL